MRVKVNEGELEGGKKQSQLTGKEYYFFLGIPYAEPPIGDLRFKPPVPVKNWNGVKSALFDGYICPQIDYSQSHISSKLKIIGNEDCLYLNIYTPEIPSDKISLKPVMVYIHGGGFRQGSSQMVKKGPDYLINHDIVLVTLNFRLGILGFLNLNIPQCCGNFGLKDQCLALKWIKNNINSFGGDPNNITLFGESAGASSVHYHIISPMSEGLVDKAILQSGDVCVQYWSYDETPEENAFMTGRKLGFEGNDSHKLLEFLIDLPTEILLKASSDMIVDKGDKTPWKRCKNYFRPSKEKISDGAFLPDHPKNLIKISKPIPIIYGINDCEGTLRLQMLQQPIQIKTILENLHEILKQNIPECCNITYLAEKVREFYFKDELVDEDIIAQVINLFGDFMFMHMYSIMANNILSNQPTYFYDFTYWGQLNLSKSWPKAYLRGANHADELGYLFYSKHMKPDAYFDGPERKVIDNICTMWTNFAKNGNPTPDPKQLGIIWEPHTEKRPTFMRIDYNLENIAGKIWNDRINFWAEVLNVE